jgi:hypothetical protein
MGALLWAEANDDPPDEGPETEAHGEIDETFATRRLGRWLRGMFGGKAADDAGQTGDAAAKRDD